MPAKSYEFVPQDKSEKKREKSAAGEWSGQGRRYLSASYAASQLSMSKSIAVLQALRCLPLTLLEDWNCRNHQDICQYAQVWGVFLHPGTAIFKEYNPNSAKPRHCVGDETVAQGYERSNDAA